MAAPDLTSTPRRKSRAEALIWTAGTARPSAQGQVMISTATARSSASRGPRPSAHPAAKVSSAAVWTTGT